VKKYLVFLVLLIVLLGITSVFATEELVFWNWPFHVEPMKSEVVPWFQENVIKVLPEGFAVADEYGPPTYDEIRRKFILQAKTGKPDVIEGLFEYVLSYKKMGLVEPLTDRFEQWTEKDQFMPTAINALKIDGELWGVPYLVNVRLLLYRKSILEKYGLKVPETWEEFIDVTSKITSAESRKMFGFSFTSEKGEPRVFQEFISFYFQLNDSLYRLENNEWIINATPEQLTAVLSLYNDLMWKYETPGVNPEERGLGGGAQDQGFVQGKYAMVCAGPWMIGYGKNYPEIIADTGIAPLPVAPDGHQATYLEVKPIMINKFSKNKDAAWELVKFVTSKDFIALENKVEGANPPRKDVASMQEFQEDPWQKEFVTNLSTGKALEPINWELPQRAVTDAIQKVIYQQASPSEAGNWLYEELKKLAEEGKI